jgi:hypothetical protein
MPYGVSNWHRRGRPGPIAGTRAGRYSAEQADWLRIDGPSALAATLALAERRRRRVMPERYGAG